MNEEYLILRLRNKDKVVFDFIFNYYYPGLCVFAKQYTGSIESAEDLVQDFFVNLWIKASSLTVNESLRAYVFSSVKNRCLDYLKHNRVRERFESCAVDESEFLQEDNFSIYVESELREAIERSLEKLPPRCREIFYLSRFKGKSNSEISEKLGLSKRTIELQISNALKILRQELKPYLPLLLIIPGL